MATKKTKTKAAAFACQSRDQVMDAIRELGDAQRELSRINADINDQVAAITAARKDRIDALQERVDALANGIQTWCEAHRAELLSAGGKTANLITGEVSWRLRPPSVSIRAVEKVLDALRSLGLQRFIRTREEPNKEAMLADPKAVAGIAGVNIVSGVEDFTIEPFEIDAVS